MSAISALFYLISGVLFILRGYIPEEEGKSFRIIGMVIAISLLFKC